MLPALVKGLKAQTHPIDQTVAVDTASRDRSGAILAELIGQDAVFGMSAATGFGEAVATALGHATRRRSGLTDPSLARAEWIWLLHDDCEPAPDALERLVRAASRDPAVAVVGPKLLDAQDRRTLREAGVSIDRAGRRVTGIDPGEIDQGQHDHKRAVLAVSSVGMLVRREVWERLGGFDPNLKLMRDDLDFCWRVQAAGFRVHVATDAIVYHWELAGRRRRDAQGGSVRVADRRNAMYVLAVNLPLLTMFRMVGGCVIGSLARAFYFLLTKQLDLSAAYALSVLGLFAHPVRLLKARHRRARGLAEGYYAVRIFIPPAHTLAKVAEEISGIVSSGPPQASSGRHQAMAEESEEDAQFVDQVSPVRRVVAHPGVQLFVALLLISLVATRRLLGTSPLGGGALVPAWGGASALWQEYLAGFHAVSMGTSASAPPYLAVVAALGTVLGGQAWLAVDVLLLGCVPLAGVTAYAASRWIATATPARVLLAASYALLPVATGAVAAGRLGTAVAIAALPLIAVSAGRMLTAVPRQAHRAAWATGLLIGLAAAFAPLVWVLGVVFAVAALGVRRWSAAVTPLNAAIVAVTPFFVLFPWSLSLLTSPSGFLLEAGLTAPGLTTHGLGATALLALSPGGPGVPPVWVTAGFGLALVALVLPARRLPVIIGGWAVAVTGLLAAVVLSRVSVTPPTGGAAAAGWPGVALALAALGLLVAAAPAAEWLASTIPNGTGLRSAGNASAPGSARRVLAVAALVGAATAPLLVAAYWVKDGVRGPVDTVSAPLLPAFVSASSNSGAQYRTLILRPEGAGLAYQVVRQGDPTLGAPELGMSASAEAALSRQVAALGTPDGADAGDPGLVLGSFGIRWVLLPSPVNAQLASRLDAAPGIVALNKGPAYDLWQVTGSVGRVTVVAPSGTTTVLSSGTVNLTGAAAPASGGTLMLAEPYGGWTAKLNGQDLKPVATPVNGWAQAFVLPPGGGRLSVTRNDLARPVSLFVELIATLAVIVLALPGKRVAPVEDGEAQDAVGEAKGGATGRRAGRAAGPGRLRPGGPGHRAGSGADRTGPGRRRRQGAPEEPVPSAVPSRDAEPARPVEPETVITTVGRLGRDRPAGPSGRTTDTGSFSAAPWDMAGEWGRPGSSTGQHPALPEARDLSQPGSAAGRRGEPEREARDPSQPSLAAGRRGDPGYRTPEPPQPAPGARRRDDADWPEAPARNDEPAKRAPDAESPFWTDTEGPDEQEPAKPPAWRGALARLTGQQPALTGPATEEPAPGAPGSPAAAERPDEADWLEELLKKNGVSQSSPAAESPALGSPLPEAPAPGARPAWDAAPRSAPADSGPQSPVTAAGTPRRAPGESGPRATGSPTGAQPAPRTGAQPAARPEAQSAWRTDAKSAWGTGAFPAARGASQPAPRTGAQPASRTGSQPASRTGAQPASRTEAQPTFTPTGPQPTFTPTGPQPTFAPSGPQPTFTPTGAHPTFNPGNPGTQGNPGTPGPQGDGPPASSSGAHPTHRAPWESGDWGKAPDWDAMGGGRNALPARRDTAEAGRAAGPDDRPAEPGRPPSSGSWPSVPPGAEPSAKPERHSHRGGKHGKPSRWRGSGKDGGS